MDSQSWHLGGNSVSHPLLRLAQKRFASSGSPGRPSLPQAPLLSLAQPRRLPPQLHATPLAPKPPHGEAQAQAPGHVAGPENPCSPFPGCLGFAALRVMLQPAGGHFIKYRWSLRRSGSLNDVFLMPRVGSASKMSPVTTPPGQHSLRAGSWLYINHAPLPELVKSCSTVNATLGFAASDTSVQTSLPGPPLHLGATPHWSSLTPRSCASAAWLAGHPPSVACARKPESTVSSPWPAAFGEHADGRACKLGGAALPPLQSAATAAAGGLERVP